MAYYYRVNVVKDEDGAIRPDINAKAWSVVQYLDDGTAIVRTNEEVEGLEPLTIEQVNALVTSPIYKLIDMVDKVYGFRDVEGVIRVGVDRDGIICLRIDEWVEVPVAVDAEGNILEKRKVRRTRLIRPPVDRMLAVKNNKLVVVEEATEDKLEWLKSRKRELEEALNAGSITKEEYDAEMAKLPKVDRGWLVYDNDDVEIPIVGGGSITLGEIRARMKWVG